MRVMMAGALALGAAQMLAGCGGGSDQENREAADARAAGFTPPSVISRADFAERASRRFRSLDNDGDDALDRGEWTARNPDRLEELDKNGDGRLTQIEHSEGTLARFDAMDLNRDGSLTSEERRTSQRGARR